MVMTGDSYASGNSALDSIASVRHSSWFKQFNPADSTFYNAENFRYNATGHRQLADYLCSDFTDFGAGNPFASGGIGPADNIDLVFVIDTTGSVGDDKGICNHNPEQSCGFNPKLSC